MNPRRTSGAPTPPTKLEPKVGEFLPEAKLARSRTPRASVPPMRLPARLVVRWCRRCCREAAAGGWPERTILSCGACPRPHLLEALQQNASRWLLPSLVSLMISRRILAVTGVVALVGGVVGAAGGTLILAVMSFAIGSPLHGIRDAAIFGIAGLIGFVHGALLGPLLSWALMREIPIWRAIGETAIAASAVAAVVIFSGFSLIAASAGAFAAALLAAGRLKVSWQRRAQIRSGTK